MSNQDYNLNERARQLMPPFGTTLLRAWAPMLVILASAVAMQLLLRRHIDSYVAILLATIGTNIVLAVSLTIVNGFTGQFSMGHAGFLAVGGYAAGCVTYYRTLAEHGDSGMRGGVLSGGLAIIESGLPWLTAGDVLFLFSLLVGGTVAAILGYLVGLPSLRLKGDYLAIVTLGFGEIVRVLIQQTGPKLSTAKEVADASLLSLPTRVGGALGFSGLPTYTSLFWVYLVVGVTLLVAFRIKRSTFGRAFLSIREDEIASEAMGVDTTRYKVRAFVIAAFFAGVAGGLFAHTLGVGLSAEAAGFQKSFDIIIMVVLGGLGSISGAVVAAIIVTLLPEMLRGVRVGPVDLSDYRLVIYALALILVMIIRPRGIFGVREIWEKSFWAGLFRRGK